MKHIVLIILALFSSSIFCQGYGSKKKYLIGTFHTQNTTINGISAGFFPQLNDKNRFVKTNGIRLEIPGIGFLMPIGNGSPISRIDSVNSKFNRNN